jgi:hypothetical protein
MTINIDKSQVMRISRGYESLWIKLSNREPKKVAILNAMELCKQDIFIAKGKSRRELS